MNETSMPLSNKDVKATSSVLPQLDPPLPHPENLLRVATSLSDRKPALMVHEGHKWTMGWLPKWLGKGSWTTSPIAKMKFFKKTGLSQRKLGDAHLSDDSLHDSSLRCHVILSETTWLGLQCNGSLDRPGGALTADDGGASGSDALKTEAKYACLLMHTSCSTGKNYLSALVQ